MHRTQAKFRLRRKKGLGPNSEELISKGLYSSGFSKQTEPTGCADALYFKEWLTVVQV